MLGHLLGGKLVVREFHINEPYFKSGHALAEEMLRGVIEEYLG